MSVKKVLIEYDQRLLIPIEDPVTRFKVRILAATPNPQTVIYQGLHQDYSSNWVGDIAELSKVPNEEKCGEIAINRLLKGNRNHFGVFEHPQITFACGYINHTTWQQLRTHRIGVSFDIQSFRYTYEHLIKAANVEIDIENIIYFDKYGIYKDRNGNTYNYNQHEKIVDIDIARNLLKHYKSRVEAGMPPERARRMLPFDYRQHGVFTANLRSLMHILDLRSKADAQSEIVVLSNMLFQLAKIWAPQIMEWYEKNRLGRALLAP